MISTEYIQAIRDNTSLAAVVRESVALTEDGAHLRGTCPFCGAEGTTLLVNDARGFYHCLACKKAGTVIDYVMSEGRSFAEAIAILEERLRRGTK